MLERVKNICSEKGTNLKELAKKMGITYQSLYAALSGNPTIGKIQEIANTLGVHYLEILDDRQEVKILIEYEGKTKRITDNDLIKLFKEK